MRGVTSDSALLLCDAVSAECTLPGPEACVAGDVDRVEVLTRSDGFCAGGTLAEVTK